ncbi:MAG: SoxR reducing system RseC family protein [Oscillibacter sp.]|jgi:sigma-E factor negative regulatory protein RseC|nr:SoxR reducing system RseC family protein [Oscillibacter sp.]
MTQIATVERILDPGHAEISVPRKSACGHDCEECAGCGVTGAAVHARAKNPIGAAPGQKVVVESSTKKMLWIITLAYMVPVALFLAGYLGGVLLSGSIAVQYALAVAGFALGLLIAVGYDRRLRRQGGLSFTIVRLF